MVFWMSLVAFDDLVRPVDDEAGSLVQLKTLKLPEHASRGSNGSEWSKRGERGGKAHLCDDQWHFSSRKLGKIKRKAHFFWSHLAGLKTKIQRRVGGGGSISRVGTSA